MSAFLKKALYRLLYPKTLKSGLSLLELEDKKMGLTNNQQAIMMAIAFLIPVGTWAALGFPIDRISLGILASALISSVVATLKEYLGSNPTTTTSTTPSTT